MRTTNLLGVSRLVLGLASRPCRPATGRRSRPTRSTKDKPGYGGLSGVVVDHATGDVYVCVSDLGLFRSKDQGKTWQRLSTAPPKGRTEWPGCLQTRPDRQEQALARRAASTAAPSPSAPLDGGDWKILDNKSSHIDWCAVDWTDPDLKFVLALKHESGGTLIASPDGGKTFDEIGKGYGPAWVFDKHDGGRRGGEDEGQAEAGPGAHDRRRQDVPAVRRLRSATALPKWRDGALYWLTDGALIRTTDAGKTWEKVGDVKDGRYGPIFGKDAKQMFVLTGAGVVESTDGGATWSKPIAPPKDLKGVSALTWIDYDPMNDVLYIMKMGSDLYRMERGKK